MNNSAIVTFLCLFAIQIFFSTALHHYGEGQFEIIEGNCGNPDPKDLVFRDHVVKTGIPFTVRTETSTWHGDETIYCLMATSEKEESKGSTVEIKEGGLNHSYVTLKMKSGRGNGMDYYVKVYAK